MQVKKETKPFYIKKIIFNNKQIVAAITKAAKWVDKTYKDKIPLIVGVLNGCIPFYGHLISKIKIDCKCDFIKVSSFIGTATRQSEPKFVTKPSEQIKGEDILIIDDIVDSGKSALVIKKYLLNKGAKSVKIISLLDKKTARQVNCNPDYACFKVQNVFLTGFGLDVKEKLRNLPYIAEFDVKFINKI